MAIRMSNFNDTILMGLAAGFVQKKMKESENPTIQHFNNKVAQKQQEFRNAHPTFTKYSDKACNLIEEAHQYTIDQTMRLGGTQYDYNEVNHTLTQFRNIDQEYNAAARVSQNMSGIPTQNAWDFKD